VKIKQQRAGFNTCLKVGGGPSVLEIETEKGTRAARARVNARASDGRGVPDGSEGLQRVHVPGAACA
jgi:hypothetical protein